MDTWGLLPKAQDDNKTIEQVIDEKIAAHDAANSAHDSAGGSLANHKASTVVDHLARSVYQDKMAYDRWFLNTKFETLDGWTKSAAVTLEYFGQVRVNSSATYGQDNYIQATMGGEANEMPPVYYHPFWQTTISLFSASQGTAFIGNISLDKNDGYGFKLVNNNLYAIYFDWDNVEHIQSIGTIPFDTRVRLGTNYDEAGVLHFFVNGTEVYSVTPASIFGSMKLMSYHTNYTAGHYMWIYVFDLVYEMDYPS